MRRGLPALALPAATVLGLALAGVRRADALDVTTPRLELPGRVKAVRARDVDGDGRVDLVVVVERREPDRLPASEVVVLRSPAEPSAATFFRGADVVRIPCAGEGAGGHADHPCERRASPRRVIPGTCRWRRRSRRQS